MKERTKTEKRVLVLNAYSRSGLAVINSLPSRYEVIGGEVERTRHRFGRPDHFFRSQRLLALFRYPDPVVAPQAFAEKLIEQIGIYGADAVLPAGHPVSETLAKLKGQITAATDATILVEDHVKARILFDKWETFKLCKDLGIATPDTCLASVDGDWIETARELNQPLVVKARDSWGSHDVMFFDTARDAAAYLNNLPDTQRYLPSGEDRYIVQSYTPGKQHHVNMLCREGEALAGISEQRVCCKYDHGGPAIACLTTRIPEIIETSKSLLGGLAWNGVCQCEFIQSEDGNFRLLECNPRIWGATALSTAAGLNIVERLVEVFVEDADPEPCFDYGVGVLYRWWFPECMQRLIQWPWTPRRLARRLREIVSRHGAVEARGNLQREDLRHLAGQILDHFSTPVIGSEMYTREILLRDRPDA
ncbi:MAG: ATP-grasp domain-containing protein [Gammaproteobacteria bacterium]